MSMPRLVRRVTTLALLCSAALIGQAAGGGSAPIAQAQTGGLGSGGEYHALTPARIFETRGAGINNAAPGPRPSSPAGLAFNIDVLGQGGVPAEVGGVNRDVLAVVLNVTVIDPTAAGYLSISPTGSGAGVSSLVNFGQGENVPNLAVVGAGTERRGRDQPGHPDRQRERPGRRRRVRLDRQERLSRHGRHRGPVHPRRSRPNSRHPLVADAGRLGRRASPDDRRATHAADPWR